MKRSCDPSRVSVSCISTWRSGSRRSSLFFCRASSTGAETKKPTISSSGGTACRRGRAEQSRRVIMSQLSRCCDKPSHCTRL